MSEEFQVSGQNDSALFNLKLHRGDGMCLIAMNWKEGEPPADFIGFAIEYKEPGGDRFFALKNRMSFPGVDLKQDRRMQSTRLSPIQKFRWVHFPRNADKSGPFVYRVSPVFMNDSDELSYGEPQEVAIELRRETYPGLLNVTFTRGFVSSQAFVERYESAGPISTLLPPKAADGLTFQATHPKTKEALEWMGFEARSAILNVLDAAIKDQQTEVRVIAYDLSEPEVVSRLKQLKDRLKIIIDDSDDHKADGSGENQAQDLLKVSAGANNVRRQHMKNLQHNKTIVVTGPNTNMVACGSTNFTWRGFYVQNNNAVILQGKDAVAPFLKAFEQYWAFPGEDFGGSASAERIDLGIPGIDAIVTFSFHGPSNAILQAIANDVMNQTTSSLFFALAFLYQTTGALRDAIQSVFDNPKTFVYGISDKQVGGMDLQKPSGNPVTVFPSQLKDHLPPQFTEEPSGGRGIRLHHKFIVIDFDKPTARVYLGSYNFSEPADDSNGENLLLIRDRRIAVSYMIEAIRIIDHYHFRVALEDARAAQKEFALSKPPRQAGEVAWWKEYYSVPHKIRDRELFA
jgi:phosphatidylserine/phosphatidylglycerophosphate/cardiolipin synthase-like enzyme